MIDALLGRERDSVLCFGRFILSRYSRYLVGTKVKVEVITQRYPSYV